MQGKLSMENVMTSLVLLQKAGGAVNFSPGDFVPGDLRVHILIHGQQQQFS